MNDEKLIPELSEWRKLNGSDFSIEDWIISEGNINFSIGYSLLFWPEFIEFENWRRSENIKNYAQIESVLNHIHIIDLFGTDEKKDEVNYEQIMFLGNKICEMYRAKLQFEYPEKEFIFEFNGFVRHLPLDEYEITFYQNNNLTVDIN